MHLETILRTNQFFSATEIINQQEIKYVSLLSRNRNIEHTGARCIWHAVKLHALRRPVRLSVDLYLLIWLDS